MAWKQTEFSGGITDEYLNGPANAARKLDNVLLDELGRPVQRPGLDVYSTLAPQIPPGNQRIDDLYHFDGVLFAKSGTKLYYLVDGAASWVELQGPTGNVAFADSELGAKCSWSEWRGHLIITPNPGPTVKGGCRTMKIYKNGSGTWTLVQAGMPAISRATTGGFVASMTYTVGGVNTSYVWYYCFRRTYVAKVNGVNSTFEDIGNPEIYQDAGDPMGVSSLSNGSRNFTNAAGENFDTATMVVRTYRTKGNGKRPYYVNDTALGTTLTDTLADGALGAEAHAGMEYGNYNDPVPLCYYSFILDQSGFYAAAVDQADSSLKTNRVWQSRPTVNGGVPSGNFVELEGTVITGANYARNVPVVFFHDRCYRIEGRLNASGGGNLRAVLISSVEGMVGAKSIRTDDGIVFVSENGICFTDGYQVVNLTKKGLKKTFKALSVAKAIGAYDSESGRVFLGVESSDLVPTVTGKNNALFVLDRNFSSPDRGVFTTASAETNLQPCSLFYDSVAKVLLIGDQRGYVMKFNPAKMADLVVNTATAPSSWARKAVIWDIITCAIDFGEGLLEKLLSKLYILAKNVSSQLSIDLSIYVDAKSSPVTMQGVRERGITSGLHNLWRWFPQGGRRATVVAQRVTKGYCVICNSDTYGTATMAGVGNTAQLGAAWPTDGGETLVGHDLYTEADGYVTAYSITVHSGDTLTVNDPGNTFPTGAAKKWLVKGYPKGEDLELHALSMDAAALGGDYKDFAAGDSGSNT